MGKIIGFFLVWLTKKVSWSVVYYALALAYFLSMVAMVSAFFIGLDFFINQIRTFLLTITTFSGGGDVLDKFMGALNCVGVTQAFNDTIPAVSSALVFLLSRVLIVQINKFYLNVFGIVSSLMKSGI